MPSLLIRRLDADSDGSVKLLLRASNDLQVAQQDIYTYPDTVMAWAKDLCDFPAKRSVALEYDAGYAHALLRALTIDAQGHSAIEVLFDNKETPPPDKASAHFFLPCNPATINSIGKELLGWVGSPEEDFQHEWGANW